jgi:hypothetical protein
LALRWKRIWPSFRPTSGQTHSLEGGPDYLLSRSQPVWAGHLAGPAHQRAARALRPTPVNQRSKRARHQFGRASRNPARQARLLQNEPMVDDRAHVAKRMRSDTQLRPRPQHRLLDPRRRPPRRAVRPARAIRLRAALATNGPQRDRTRRHLRLLPNHVCPANQGLSRTRRYHPAPVSENQLF